jgi:hypothetical protein
MDSALDFTDALVVGGCFAIGLQRSVTVEFIGGLASSIGMNLHFKRDVVVIEHLAMMAIGGFMLGRYFA